MARRKISCPECSKVLVCGVGKRPANLQCSACQAYFVLKPNRPKVEVSCPSCNRKLRMNKKLGVREVFALPVKPYSMYHSEGILWRRLTGWWGLQLHHNREWFVRNIGHLFPFARCWWYGRAYTKGGVLTDYIWAAMLCILYLLWRYYRRTYRTRYSKKQLLGGSLDIMSDSISFCVAPALMVFAMFGRWGEATPIWTISLA